MAVNPIQFLIATNASVASGATTVNVTGNVDCSRVFSGSAVFIGGAATPVEGIRGTAPNGSGNSTITLRTAWPHATINNAFMVVFNTNEGLADAIVNVREIVSNISAIENLVGQGIVRKLSDNSYELVNISTQGINLITATDAGNQRTVLGLGTAATATVTTSPTDTTAGRLLKVGDFGLGDNTPPEAGDPANILGAGIYADLGNTTNSADNLAYWGSLLAMPATNGKGFLHIRTQETGRVKGWLGRSASDGTGLLWEEIYHTGNTGTAVTADVTTSATDTTAGRLLKVGDFGLGAASTPPSVNDANTLQPSGFYAANGAAAVNFSPVIQFAPFIAARRQSTQATQANIHLGRIGNVNSVIVRNTLDAGATWISDELYHTGNTNFNEFGGVAANDVVATGFAQSATQATFYLPINSYTAPTGISVTSTFNVARADYTVVASTLTPTSVGAAGNKMAVVTVTGLTGLTVGQPLLLRQDTTTSKITVNF